MKDRKTKAERSIRGMVVSLRSRAVQETRLQGDYKLSAGEVAPTRSLAPSAGSEILSQGLCRISREIRPPPGTPARLMQPTQSTGLHLLL
jgi:hypothetical protein